MDRRRIFVVGVANGYGAGNPACQDGPEVLRALRFLADLEKSGNSFRWDEPIRLADVLPGDPVGAVESIADRLADRVAQHVLRGDFPLVIGGDHSCAIGTWSGVKRALGAEARFARRLFRSPLPGSPTYGGIRHQH
ncbi:MAG: arginase family protein [Rhodocyclales bacterium]|nr:arginase family protein [Rhodocyclales bacterium]